MMRRSCIGWIAVGLAMGIAGCQKSPPASEAESQAIVAATAALEKTPAPSNAKPPVVNGDTAEIGKPAPAFELLDLDGKALRLSDFRGKVVVLEWFNPGCPFVRAAHTKGSLVNTAQRLQQQGVVYLAINSAAPGKQGHGADANRAGAQAFHLEHPILLDETGAVGKAYGATNTPHVFVIDGAGTLVYRGAIDNSPDGEGESPEGGKLTSFLDEAVTSVMANKPVKIPETKAYGCSVKYGS